MPLSFTMKNRLSSILHDYQQMNELNNYTDSHISHCTFLLCTKPYNEVLNYLVPYKFDIQLAIDYHKQNVQDYPTNTYNKLTKIIQQM